MIPYHAMLCYVIQFRQMPLYLGSFPQRHAKMRDSKSCIYLNGFVNFFSQATALSSLGHLAGRNSLLPFHWRDMSIDFEGPPRLPRAHT